MRIQTKLAKCNWMRRNPSVAQDCWRIIVEEINSWFFQQCRWTQTGSTKCWDRMSNDVWKACRMLFVAEEWTYNSPILDNGAIFRFHYVTMSWCDQLLLCIDHCLWLLKIPWLLGLTFTSWSRQVFSSLQRGMAGAVAVWYVLGSPSLVVYGLHEWPWGCRMVPKSFLLADDRETVAIVSQMYSRGQGQIWYPSERGIGCFLKLLRL